MTEVQVKRILLWVIIVGTLMIGFILYYRSGSGDDLNVTPEAQREIDKAKRQ